MSSGVSHNLQEIFFLLTFENSKRRDISPPAVLTQGLLQLLLGADVGGVTTCLFTAVGRPGVEASVALAADHLVAVVLLGQNAKRGLDHTAAKTKDQVEGRLFLDVIVRESTPVLELLAGKDQPLLVWGDSLLVLDLSLNILNGI